MSKSKQAIGLGYNGSNAPSLVAKGFDGLAEQIIDLAKANGVLVHEDPELANSLAQLDVGEEIPRDLYVIIAELIAFAYLLDGRFPEHWTMPEGMPGRRFFGQA
ncbi:MAG: EscU/YscU/HrcU family type III secretion system export apparatus switch protein [Idiomarina sp.]